MTNMTEAEQHRVDLMKPLGCLACASAGWLNLDELELHHLIEGNRRLGHLYTIFLCRGHHQGHWNSVTTLALLPRYRVAISDGRKRFNAVFGSERSLWERAQVTIKDPTEWPESKILPRRVCP
jgi:Recombination enhancement, RecA-dependent nuclease